MLDQSVFKKDTLFNKALAIIVTVVLATSVAIPSAFAEASDEFAQNSGSSSEPKDPADEDPGNPPATDSGNVPATGTDPTPSTGETEQTVASDNDVPPAQVSVKLDLGNAFLNVDGQATNGAQEEIEISSKEDFTFQAVALEGYEIEMVEVLGANGSSLGIEQETNAAEHTYKLSANLIAEGMTIKVATKVAVSASDGSNVEGETDSASGSVSIEETNQDIVGNDEFHDVSGDVSGQNAPQEGDSAGSPSAGSDLQEGNQYENDSETIEGTGEAESNEDGQGDSDDADKNLLAGLLEGVSNGINGAFDALLDFLNGDSGATENDKVQVTVNLDGETCEGEYTIPLKTKIDANIAPEIEGYTFQNARVNNSEISYVYALGDGRYYVIEDENQLAGTVIGDTKSIVLYYQAEVETHAVSYNVKINGTETDNYDTAIELVGADSMRDGETLTFSVAPKYGSTVNGVFVDVDGVQQEELTSVGNNLYKVENVNADVAVTIEVAQDSSYSFKLIGEKSSSNTQVNVGGNALFSGKADSSTTYEPASLLSFTMSAYNQHNSDSKKHLNKLVFVEFGELSNVGVSTPSAKGESAITVLSNGMKVTVEWTNEDGEAGPDGNIYSELYTVTISAPEETNVAGDIELSANFKDNDRKELWVVDASGIESIRGVELWSDVYVGSATDLNPSLHQLLHRSNADYESNGARFETYVYFKVQDGFSKNPQDYSLKVIVDGEDKSSEYELNDLVPGVWGYDKPQYGKDFDMYVNIGSDADETLGDRYDIRISINLKSDVIKYGTRFNYTEGTNANGSDSGLFVYQCNLSLNQNILVSDGIGIPKRDGYVFAGWKLKGTDNVFDPNDIFTIDEDTVEYAQHAEDGVNYFDFEAVWEPANEAVKAYYTINIYFADEATGQYQSKPSLSLKERGVINDVAYILPDRLKQYLESYDNLPSKWEYYELDAEQSTTTVSVTGDNNATIDLKYHMVPVIVTFNPGDHAQDNEGQVTYKVMPGSKLAESKILDNGESDKCVTVPKYTEKQGFKLVGWISSAKGDGEVCSTNEVENEIIAGNVTYTAQWKADGQISVSGYSGVYDGKEHHVAISGTCDGDQVVLTNEKNVQVNNSFTNVDQSGEVTVSVYRDKEMIHEESVAVGISKRLLCASGFATKTYDGTNVLLENVPLRLSAVEGNDDSGVVESDENRLSAVIAKSDVCYDDSNVHEAKQLKTKDGSLLSKIKLSGAAAGNYAVEKACVVGSISKVPENGAVSLKINARPYSDEYDAAEHAAIEDGGAFVAKRDSMTHEEGWTITYFLSENGDVSENGAYSDNIPNVKDAGRFYVYMKATNENYEDELTAQVQAVVSPRSLKVTSGSVSKYYDGNPLICHSATVDGLAGGETIGIEYTGSQTEIGTSENAFSVVFAGEGNGYSAKDSNYVTTLTFGELTVNSRPSYPVNPPVDPGTDPEEPGTDPDGPDVPSVDPDLPDVSDPDPEDPSTEPDNPGTDPEGPDVPSVDPGLPGVEPDGPNAPDAGDPDGSSPDGGQGPNAANPGGNAAPGGVGPSDGDRIDAAPQRTVVPGVATPLDPAAGTVAAPTADAVQGAAEAAIPDEDTPLAEESISDDATPLASGEAQRPDGQDGHADCWVHWCMILGALVSAAYFAVVGVRRKKHEAGLRGFESRVLEGCQRGARAAGETTEE